jgi:ABC-2 type transport system permease protein
MNQFFTFIRKETQHILRDTYTLVILLLMPTVLLLILGYAVTNEIKDAPFTALDLSHSPLSGQLVEQLDASPCFALAGWLTAPDQIEKTFQKGKCKVVVVFPSTFEQDFFGTGLAELQLIIDASDPNEASTLDSYLQSVIRQFEQDFSAEQSGITVKSEVKMLYNPQMKSAYGFVPGLMGLLMMLVCAMMTSISIVREKERGTMEILLISPLKPASIVLAKTVPYFIISLIDVVLIMLIAVFVMGVPVVGNLLTIIVLSIVFTLSALSLGMLISSVTRQQIVAMILSIVGLMVPSMLLSGVLFPIDSIPYILQVVSNIIPVKWYISAIRVVMIKGGGLAAIWQEIAVLSGMTVALLFISVKSFKNRL